MMKNKGVYRNVFFMAQAAAIAAIYVVLTLVFAPFSFGEVQVRIAEALTILPIFTPAAVPGLFVGCLIGNVLGGALLPDIIFGRSCHTDRRGIYLAAEGQKKGDCLHSAGDLQRCDCSAGSAVCLRC